MLNTNCTFLRHLPINREVASLSKNVELVAVFRVIPTCAVALIAFISNSLAVAYIASLIHKSRSVDWLAPDSSGFECLDRDGDNPSVASIRTTKYPFPVTSGAPWFVRAILALHQIREDRIERKPLGNGLFSVEMQSQKFI